MTKKISFFFLLLTLTIAPLFSEPGHDQSFLNDFVGKSWTTEDGLPGMTIVAMLQDKNGYIYLGTYDGLVRFDGVEFAIYSRAYDEKYQFATAHALLQDCEGNIWIGHNDEGLSCLSPDGSVTKYTVGDGLLNNKINALAEDADHNIWIGTATGPCYLTPERKFVIPKIADDIKDTITSVSMYCDTSGKIWIAAGTELYVYEDSILHKFSGFKSLDSHEVYYVTQDRSDAFWFALSPHYAIRVKNGEETLFNLSHGEKEGAVVSDILQDSLGNIWFATDCGIVVLHNGKYSYFDMQNGLPDDGVNHLMEDHEGNIWLGLNRGGLYKMSYGKFITVPTDSSINGICEDQIRKVTWLASDTGVLCYKDGSFISNNLTELTKGLRIRHVGMDKSGELLVCAFSLDIPFIRLSKNGSIKTWSVEDGIVGNRARVAIKSSDGDYYVGTAQGLSVIHKDGKIETLSKKVPMENVYIMWLYEDSEKCVWVGTNGGGVYALKDEQIVRHYSTEDGLSGNVIFKIWEQDGDFWIATGTGLSYFDREKDSFINFNSLNGLGTDSVFQMLTDSNGTAWMLSNKGIISTKVSEMKEVIAGQRKKLAVHNYGKSDGLVTGGATSTAYSLKDSAGNLWFTLVDGFAIYKPEKASWHNIAPVVDVQSYIVDTTSHDYHGEKIILPPNAQRLSIKYTGITFLAPEHVTFSYKLEGFESDFSDWGSTRVISYTNIKPGTYKFSVMALNNDGIQSEPCPPVTIIKKPHIWQNIWFWVAMILLVVLIVFASVRYKIYTMKRYQRELEEKVEERTRELKAANDKSEKLLLNILPSDVAKELTEHPDKTIAEKFPNAAVLFTDIVNFTKMSDKLSAEEVVTFLNRMVSKFDERAKREGIEKIKTIGDAYMAACGLSKDDNPENIRKMIVFAQGLLEDVHEFNKESPVKVSIRIGVNCGNLVAGVIGKSKFIYDIWGDTVNVASRMESTGEPMRIHVTEAVHEQTKNHFSYSDGVELEVKGKGKMKTYFIS